MTRYKRYSTKGPSPLGTIANFKGNGFRMVTANTDRTKALTLAQKNNGIIRRCEIDGRKAWAVYYPK